MFKLKPKLKEKKLGLALGSGGAKGLAHLGILKAFEEENIQFNVVSGASIGSIVGALYANGYSSTDIFELLKRIDLSDVKKLIMLRMNMNGIETILNDVLDDITFEELKIPFAAVAADLNSGKEVVFKSGNVAKALTASSAIAPIFKPVNIDGMSLVDGAYVNAIPADIAKELGADFVIGVDLSAYKINEPISKGFLDEFFPTNKIANLNSRLKGYKFSDYMLQPDLKNFHSTSLMGADEMYEIGYDLVKEKIQEIKIKLIQNGIKL